MKIAASVGGFVTLDGPDASSPYDWGEARYFEIRVTFRENESKNGGSIYRHSRTLGASLY